MYPSQDRHQKPTPTTARERLQTEPPIIDDATAGRIRIAARTCPARLTKTC
jgi:hypothetical protein